MCRIEEQREGEVRVCNEEQVRVENREGTTHLEDRNQCELPREASREG